MFKIKLKIVLYILSSILLFMVSIVVSQYFINQFVEIYDGQKSFFEKISIKDKKYEDILKFENRSIPLNREHRDFFNLKDNKAPYQTDEEEITIEVPQIISSPVILPEYKIAFIIVKANTKVVMIDSKIYNEGDKIGIEIIKKIEPKRVLLESATTKRWIRF